MKNTSTKQDNPTKFKLAKNKWFYVYTVAAALALAGILIALIIVLAPNRDPEFIPGDEVGIYYYDTAEGEWLITLKDSAAFLLDNTYTQRTGEYRVDGDKLKLDFINDEDGIAEGTITSNKILLDYNGATLRFYKQVDYTVTYDGFDDLTEKVTNGKTATEPTVTNKENYNFAGWYMDKARTKPFNFDTPITADTTVYAKWIKGN